MKNNLKNRYSHEIHKIENRLRDLEQGFVTDLHPHVKMYGSLHHNISELRKDFYDLLLRVDNDEPSAIDAIFKGKLDKDI